VEVERGVCPALTLTARLPGADSLPSIRVRPLGAVPAGEMLLQLQTSGGQQPGSCFRLSPRAESMLDVDLMVAYSRAASTNLQSLAPAICAMEIVTVWLFIHAR
jgi:hypothetical protein